MANKESYSTKNSASLKVSFWLQWLTFMVVILVFLRILVYQRIGYVPTYFQVFAILVVFCSLPVYAGLNVYQKDLGYLYSFRRLLAAWLLLLALLAAVGFLTKTSALFSREVLVKWSLMGFPLQMIVFIPLHMLIKKLAIKYGGAKCCAIIAVDQFGEIIAKEIVSRANVSIAGIVAHSDLKLGDALGSVPVIGRVEDLRWLIDCYGIDSIYIALPASLMDEIKDIYIDLLDTSLDITWIPDLGAMMLVNQSVSHLGNFPAIHLNRSPLTANPSAAIIKATMDKLLATIGMLVLSPLFIVIATAIKATSKGPVFYRQSRHGWNSSEFSIWKFRTMYLHEDHAVRQATKNDPRITSVGRWLRRTSIDELPQLFNVIRGEMSLVGPRPHAVSHNSFYSKKIHAYMARHRIKPGMTGLAQVNGARGETESLDKMVKRFEYDMEYINSWSVWLDVKILVKTILKLSSNAY